MLHITLRELEVFAAIHQQGGITVAGKALGLSQSATSGALAELEHRLGVTLFDRIGRRVQLNAHGRHLLPKALELLAQAQAIEDVFSEGAPCRLKVAASLTIGNYVLPALLAELNPQYPDDHYEVSISNSHAVMTLLRNCEADIGLIETPLADSQLVSERWLSDEMVVHARADHPFVRKVPTREELASVGWILREPGSGVRQTFETLLLPYLGHVNIALELGSGEAIREAMRLGMGVGFASRRAVQRELQSGEFAQIPVPALVLQRHFYLVWHAERRLTAGAERFRSACHDWLERES